MADSEQVSPPGVGETVHYVNKGPRLTCDAYCRAAIVTERFSGTMTAGLCVLGPGPRIEFVDHVLHEHVGAEAFLGDPPTWHRAEQAGGNN